jgi:predicted nuclease with TOPRIM domain
VIVTMEKESPLAKTVAELQNDDRMLEVRERLEQLKARNTTLQEENLKLGGRLERAVIEIQSFEVEKEHAEEMESENTTLRRQMKELETILSRLQRPKMKTPTPTASPSRTAVDKENPAKSKDKSTKKTPPWQGSKGGLKSLFKRRGLSEEIIKEEEEEVNQ